MSRLSLRRQGVNRQGREDDHLLASRADSKIGWSLNSISTYVFVNL
jgi:hypothetical protein